MIDPFLEAEYNNSAKVPEAADIVAEWIRAAADFRASHAHAEFDVAYGPSGRQVVDTALHDHKARVGTHNDGELAPRRFNLRVQGVGTDQG